MKKNLAIFSIILFSSAMLQINNVYAGKVHASRKAKTTNETSTTDYVCADDLLNFAQTLIGTRYRSASSSPVHGFDCSGFVSYVFKNFDFDVPRSSREFIDVGEKVTLEDAKPGDVILFTGTSKRSRKIGHVAIVMSNDAGSELTFIHSTSGKEHGVTITTMDERYKRRFVQIIRLLKQNNEG
jgi:lipoprotein Spr